MKSMNWVWKAQASDFDIWVVNESFVATIHSKAMDFTTILMEICPQYHLLIF